MLRLICLLLVPGFFAQFVVEKNKIKNKDSLGKRVMGGVLYSYIIFLLDMLVLAIFYNIQYADLLFSFGRRMNAVGDLFLFTLLLFIQLLIAYTLAIVNRIITYKSIENAFITMSQLQKNCAGGVILLSVIAVIFTFTAKDNAEQGLVINEICSKNDDVIKDQNGNSPDYVEIYNPSGWSVSLKGFRLSDQADLKKHMELVQRERAFIWQIPKGRL